MFLFIGFLSVISNSLLIQWGIIWSNTISNDYILGIKTLPISFTSDTSFIILGTAIEWGDIIQFRNLTATTATYSIYDRLNGFDCYEQAFWLAIGY